MPGPTELTVLALAGVVGGVWLLVRGFAGYREAARIGDTSTSRVATLAIGEVRVSGVVEPAELSLVSPLQSAPCVYYRSAIAHSGEGESDRIFDEERAVGFRVRDASGSVRVFPRGAQFDIPTRFDETSGMWGETPPALRPRSGSAFAMGEPSREAQIAALLTVRQPEPSTVALEGGEGALFGGGLALLGGGERRSRRYREARLEPGDIVTVVGQVLPFDQLPDPASADLGGDATNPLGALSEVESAADLAAARAAGTLAATPEEAWGNAAIPGFGIGRPVEQPDLDAGASVPALASAEEAARARRTFQIAPQDLVLAAAPDAPLLVAFGAPQAAVSRHEQRFMLGLLGAVLAIGSALVLAVALGGLLG